VTLEANDPKIPSPPPAAGAYEALRAKLEETFPLRLALVSPPRTGSTLVARILWRHPGITHHCHEPFEARYWGGAGFASVANILTRPMDVGSGERVDCQLLATGGLLVKEMTFQIGDEELLFLAGLATRPVIFVIRDPRLSTTSRLRILKELRGAQTFPPRESGWPSLAEQVRVCRGAGVPYLIVDSDRLRAEPGPTTAALGARLGLDFQPGIQSWQARPELQLCAPDVGALMGEGRTQGDPFYRRVLSSTGIEPPDAVDWEREERRIAAAGLTGHVSAWIDVYRGLLADPNLVAPMSSARPTE
jgi:hypothetical protein